MTRRKYNIFQLRYSIENTIISKGTMPLMWQSSLLFLIFSMLAVALLPAGFLFHEAKGLTWGQFAFSTIIPSITKYHMPPKLWAFLTWGFFGAWMLLATFYISIVTSSVHLWLLKTQRGKKPIKEREHIVVLGWSQKGFELVRELAQWNPNNKNTSIAILANRDAIKMRQQFNDKLQLEGKAKVLMRSGSIQDFDDINLVNPFEAKTIIILPDELEKDPDVSVVKTMLALVNHPLHKTLSPNYNIVTELQHSWNARVAHIIAKEQVTILNTLDIIARLIVQTSRQPGLSNVYSEIMAFRGVDIYFQREPSLWGKSFHDAVFSFNDTTVIGVRKSKKNMISVLDPEPFLRTKERDIVINPEVSYVLEEGDALIVISLNSQSVNLAKQRTDLINSNHIVTNAVPLKNPEKTLMIGWSENAPKILNELDAYVMRGSVIQILASRLIENDTIEHYNRVLQNIEVRYTQCDTTNRDELGRVKPNEFDHVIVLSDVKTFGAEEADSRSLISLVHLRDIAFERNAHYNIVSEMANPKNQELAHLAKPDDFIIGDNIVSRLLAQVAENRELKMVFEEFFDASGCEINLRPVEEYIQLNQEVNFYTITEAALKKGQIAIGYRIEEESQEKIHNFGITLNPTKTNPVIFKPGDRIIVIID